MKLLKEVENQVNVDTRGVYLCNLPFANACYPRKTRQYEKASGGKVWSSGMFGVWRQPCLPIQPIVNSFCRAVPPPGAVKADQAFLNINFLLRSTVLADFPSYGPLVFPLEAFILRAVQATCIRVVQE